MQRSPDMDFGLVVGVRIRQDASVSEQDSAWRVQPGGKDSDPDIIIQKHVQAAARKARRPTSHALKPKLFACVSLLPHDYTDCRSQPWH